MQKSSKSIKIRWCDYRKQSAAFLWTTAVFTYKLHYVHGGLYTNCRRVTAAVQHVQRPAMNGCKCFIQRCPYSLQVYQTSGRRSRSRYEWDWRRDSCSSSGSSWSNYSNKWRRSIDRSAGNVSLACVVSCPTENSIDAAALMIWCRQTTNWQTDRLSHMSLSIGPHILSISRFQSSSVNYSTGW